MGGNCLLMNFSRGTNCRDLTHCSNLSIARVINHIHRLSLSICLAKAGILRSLHSSTITLKLRNVLRRRRCPFTCATDTSGPEVLCEPISNEGICRREVRLSTRFRMTTEYRKIGAKRVLAIARICCQYGRIHQKIQTLYSTAKNLIQVTAEYGDDIRPSLRL